MRRFNLLVLLILLVNSCSKPTPSSQVQFDAAHSELYSGIVEDGYFLVATDEIEPDEDFEGLQYFAKQQLMYTIGQYNGIDGGPDVNRTEVEILSVEEPDEETGLTRVHYKAKLVVSLPRERPVPKNYSLILPARADYQGLREFFNLYGDEHNPSCLAWGAHDVTQGIHWYYYRPEKMRCDLEDAQVARFEVVHQISDENTEGKSPEYEKIWEDETLVSVAIFGKAEAEGSDWDVGVTAYKRTYYTLIKRFGKPIETSLEEGEQPGIENDYVKVVFDSDKGLIENHLFLVKGIRQVDWDFINRYNELTQKADFVSYSGHSGLGANIRALANMGTFAEGQYQLFLINGCDTFAYVDESLAKAHQEVNPLHGANKYLDIITNAMPSYFYENTRSNVTVIEALAEGEMSYREILSGFDRKQRAAVTGEEDNAWPLPFEE